MGRQNPYESFLKLDTGTHTARINQLLMTPDGKTLITAGGDKTIRVWDIASKTQTRMLLGQIGTGPRGSIQRIGLSPDGKYLAALVWMYPENSEDALDRETDLRVYDLPTGNLQAGFRFQGTLQDLDFSTNGKFVVLAGNKKDTKRTGRVYVYAAKDLRRGFGAMPAPLASGILHETDSLIPSLARFIPDKPGKSTPSRIVAATWIYTGGDPEYTGMLKWFTLSPSGELTMTGEQDTEQSLSPESLTAGRDYVIITTHHGDNKKFYCHDHSGTLLSVTSSETAVAQPVFSKDEKHLIVGQREDTTLVQVKVYAAAHGQFHLKSTYYGHDAEVLAVGMLEDGTVISAGGDQNAIHFWSPEHTEGELISEISGAGRTIHALGINTAEQIGVGTHDGLRYEDGRIVLQRLFDLRSMSLRPSTIEDEATYRRSQTQHGIHELRWMKENVNLWLLKSGTSSMAITGTPHPSKPKTWIWYHPSTFGFTENGTIVTGAPDGKIRVATRQPDQSYKTPLRLLGGGYSAPVKDHATSKKWLVTGGADQIIRLWFMEDVESPAASTVDPDRDTLTPALNLFIGSDDEWVIWSKSGYYNASQRGDRRFGYHINRGPGQEALYIPSDRFIKSFFRPDIIQAILETGSEERALAKLKETATTSGHIADILPPIIDMEKDVTISRDRMWATLEFSVEELNPKNPVTRVWVVRNNQFAWEEKPNSRKRYRAKLRLAPGANRLKILAETENAKAMPLILDEVTGPPVKVSSRSKIRMEPASLDDAGAAKGGAAPGQSHDYIAPPSKPGILFLLAVGVAQLEHPDPGRGFNSLAFSGADAVGIFNAFARSTFSDETPKAKAVLKNKAFETVNATFLVDRQATRDAILREIDKICDTIKKRAKTNKSSRDVLLVFLSGHGVRVTGGSNPDLYFWNYEVEFDKLLNTGFSFIELGKKITSIEADVILATDACHSGIAGSDVVSGLDANELAKRIYAINERGLYILNAARSVEEAREYGAIKHGVFTRSILDALQEDSEPDMSIVRLMDSVQRRMLKYTLRQTPVFRTYGDLLPLTIYTK